MDIQMDIKRKETNYNIYLKLSFLVHNMKCRIEILKDSEIPNAKEIDIYKDAYLLLTIEFYKPFCRVTKLDTPLNITTQKTREKIENENKDIVNQFNRSILDGIELINKEISKLKKEEQLKIFQQTKEYYTFFDNLKKHPDYLNVYSNLKNVMIHLTHEIIKKNIYFNFNSNTSLYEEDEWGSIGEGENEKKEEIELTDKWDRENPIVEKGEKANNEKGEVNNEKGEVNNEKGEVNNENPFSNENLNCVFYNLFNYVHESSNIIINNYFENYENSDSKAIEEIKKNSHIVEIEKYLFNILKENEYLMKEKKNEQICEAILLIIFKKINKIFIKKRTEETISQENNHIINIIGCYKGIDKKELMEKEMYNEKTNDKSNYSFKQHIGKYKHSKCKNVKSLINNICSKNQSYYNSYLFDYIKQFEQTILNTKREWEKEEEGKQEEEEEEKQEKEKKLTYEDNDDVEERVMEIFNVEKNKESKNIFIEVLYKYCIILLIKNNQYKQREIEEKKKFENVSEREENKKEPPEIQIETVKEKKLTEDNTSNENQEDFYSHYKGYDCYDKYIEWEQIDLCILGLSTYIEMTNLENVEGLFFLSLLYLNIHKYEEALKLLNFLIERFQKQNKNMHGQKKEEEIDMKRLYLHNSFKTWHEQQLNINEDICIYVKALCFFFQHNYVHYYINMNILLNKTRNHLVKTIENNPIVFQEELNKCKQKETSSSIKKDKKQSSIVLNEDTKEKRSNVKMDKQTEQKEERDTDNCSYDLANSKLNNYELNTNISNNTIIHSLETKNQENGLNKKMGETEEKKDKKQFEIKYDETGFEMPEINFTEIPDRDKYMLLFIINCIKLNIINIVMYIFENEQNFLTNITIQTSLYRQLIIKAFFKIKDYNRCVKLIEGCKNSLSNLETIYIYADCLYKQKKYEASIEQFKIYLSFCKYSNICASIYLKLYKMYTYIKKYEESKKSVKNSLQLYKSSYAFLYLSIYYLKKKKYVTSYKLLYKSNEISLFNHKLWVYLTTVFLHLNMKKQADKSFSNFLKMKKYDETLLEELIATYKKYGYEREVTQLKTLCQAKKER